MPRIFGWPPTAWLGMLSRQRQIDAGALDAVHPGSNDSTDVGGCLGDVLVLPHAEHRPPEGVQMSVGLTIPLDVARELGCPPRGVVRG